MAAVLLTLGVAAAAQARAGAKPEAQLAGLLEPTLARTAPVSAVRLQWPGLEFEMQQGEISLAGAVGGRVSTAVFTGRGQLRAAPPTAMGRQQAVRFTGSYEIVQSFTEAVFYTAAPDAWSSRLGAALSWSGRVPGSARDALKDAARNLERDGSDAAARWLAAEVNGPRPQGVVGGDARTAAGAARLPFSGRPPGAPTPTRKGLGGGGGRAAAGIRLVAARARSAQGASKLPRAASGRAAPGAEFLLAQLKLKDGRWIEVEFDQTLREPVVVSEPEHGQIWAQFAPPGWRPPGPAWRLGDFHLAAAIAGNRELAVEATFTLTALAPDRAALVVALDDAMRVESAALATGAAVTWLQPKAGSGGDWLYLHLPQPLAAGGALDLRLRYAGKQAMRDTALPWDWLAPALWYPTLDSPQPGPPTGFSVQITADHRYTVSASATDMVGAGASAALARVPLAVGGAGFALGEDEVRRQPVELANGQHLDLTVAAARRADPEALIPLAGSRLVDAYNFLSGYFGPVPYTHVTAVVSGPVAEPIWPGLINMDPDWFAAMTPEESQLPLAASAAGQWWGAWTEAATPHDRWLVAGLRVAGGLFYQQERSGMAAGLDALRQWRQLLQRPGRNGEVGEEQGALWLGPDRLSTDQDDGEAILEAKAAYGIYELRQMMRDPRLANPDAAFIAMMRDAAATYGGGAVTSAEFQAIVTKHMTAAMDLEHNHSMDWFFRPLLDETVTREIHFTAAIVPGGASGKAQVRMTVSNPGHWEGLLPVYLFEDSTHWIRGLMPITHEQETLTVPVPFTPRYVEANHFLDMLVTVEQ
ncbi:MAG: hypothetical protein ACRD01_15270 [Terriglobales bacterium]